MKITKKEISIGLTALGVIGVAVTSVITAKRTAKYDKSKGFFKNYWPALVSGGVTSVAIVAAEGVNLSEIGVLTGAVTFLAAKNEKIVNAFNNVKGRLGKSDREYVETFIADEPKDEKVKEVIKYVIKAGPSVEETGRGDMLCYESFSGRWFRSSEENVKQAIEKFKKLFEDGAVPNFCDFYELLGIECTDFGYMWGYPDNKDYYDPADGLDIEYIIWDQYPTHTDKGKVQIDLRAPGGVVKVLDEPVLEIYVNTWPMEGYMEV